jgi:hypothetical protein
MTTRSREGGGEELSRRPFRFARGRIASSALDDAKFASVVVLP